MATFVCLHCQHRLKGPLWRKPKACPVCGKVSVAGKDAPVGVPTIMTDLGPTVFEAPAAAADLVAMLDKAIRVTADRQKLRVLIRRLKEMRQLPPDTMVDQQWRPVQAA